MVRALCWRVNRFPHLALGLSIWLLAGCQTPAPVAGDARDDARTLTQIIAELQVYLRDDAYRSMSAAARGQRVFEDSLWRLARLQEARGAGSEPELDAVIQYAQARADERLRRYHDAEAAYLQVAPGNSVLAGPARTAASVMGRYAHVAGAAASADGTRDIASIDATLAAWRALAEEYADTRYAPLALQDAEAWEMLRVETLERSAGAESALDACRRLIERNRESKLYARHVIRLGDLYADAARSEFLRYRTRARAFDRVRYDRFLESAFAAYELAVDQRGSHDRREAETRIAALLAYHDGVRADVR
jgi:hypothetical protein